MTAKEMAASAFWKTSFFTGFAVALAFLAMTISMHTLGYSYAKLHIQG